MCTPGTCASQDPARRTGAYARNLPGGTVAARQALPFGRRWSSLYKVKQGLGVLRSSGASECLARRMARSRHTGQ